MISGSPVKAVLLALTLFLAKTTLAQDGGHMVFPESPEQTQYRNAWSLLQEKARDLFVAGKFEDAIPVLYDAISAERKISSFNRGSEGLLALTYLKLDRPKDALEHFKRTYRWNKHQHYAPEGPDVECGTGDSWLCTAEYAKLLAKQGMAAEAKAMYYFFLRRFNNETRSMEPVPFLVVFDQEPLGVYWEYTPERLEAATLMLQIMLGDSLLVKEDVAYKRIEELTPDWFYPYIFQGATPFQDSYPDGWKGGGPFVDKAELLARPGLETELMKTYRAERAAFNKLVIPDGEDPADRSPMPEGLRRRRLMTCLKPDPTVLKRIVGDE
ncbi:MAG: hypothetical protein JST40_07210 [Armatimonadetes bacterium]|nr:hypothetical protein [Armatimonadota bacterium]